MISSLSTAAGWLGLSALFGGMVFFPAVVAPRVFKVLSPASAGEFLRALFPAYYAFMIVSATIAALGFHARPRIALGLGAVALSTLLVRQLLVPRINAARDAQLAGDTSAAQRFARGHHLSVAINMVQLVFVTGAVVALALA
ncbi:MAG: DUF4149 domain-containing protein [Pseudomonadota bacterium]